MRACLLVDDALDDCRFEFHLIKGSRFRVQGVEFKVEGPGFRVQGSGFRGEGQGLRVEGLECGF